MPDRAKANGGKVNNVSQHRVGRLRPDGAVHRRRARLGAEAGGVRPLPARSCKFLRDKVPHEHGHFYHFIDMRSGEREWNCEVSNIDTALLMAGVLTVRQYFPDTELAKVANELYERVEWTGCSTSERPAAHGLEARERLPRRALGRATAKGPVLIMPDGHGLAHAPAAGQGVARVEARAGDHLCGPDVHPMPAAVHAPVPAVLVRPARAARRSRGLFPQRAARHDRAAAVDDRRAEQAVPDLRPEHVGI